MGRKKSEGDTDRKVGGSRGVVEWRQGSRTDWLASTIFLRHARHKFGHSGKCEKTMRRGRDGREFWGWPNRGIGIGRSKSPQKTEKSEIAAGALGRLLRSPFPLTTMPSKNDEQKTFTVEQGVYPVPDVAMKDLLGAIP